MNDEKKIKIAILDSGLSYYHEYLCLNYPDDDPAQYSHCSVLKENAPSECDIFHDTTGHGTSITGLIKSHYYGLLNNEAHWLSFLNMKTAYSDAKMTPIFTSASIANALEKLCDGKFVNAKTFLIINISMNWDITAEENYSYGLDPLRKLFREKSDRKKNTVLILSAGNNEKNLDKNSLIKKYIYDDTLLCNNVIVVGGCNVFGIKRKKSSFGLNTVHILAPGDTLTAPSILRTGNIEYQKMKLEDNKVIEGYIGYHLGGTSYAAPLVAGCLAIQKRLNPHYNIAQLIAAIHNGIPDTEMSLGHLKFL